MGEVTAGAEIAARAGAYRIPFEVVDGNDVWAVSEAASGAVERARAGGGPTLLECQTYRHFGHSKSDPATYRPDEEVERWLARDPLDIARRRLVADGVPEDKIATLEAQTKDRLAAAIEDALQAPFPDPGVESATEFKP
jgi:pyruvate dehydrogenase E1 component alpha subunit